MKTFLAGRKLLEQFSSVPHSLLRVSLNSTSPFGVLTDMGHIYYLEANDMSLLMNTESRLLTVRLN